MFLLINIHEAKRSICSSKETRYLPSASDMPAGVRDLYHIAPNKVRHIATELREVISYSHSEYIA